MNMIHFFPMQTKSFLENHFTGYHTERLRELSGHVSLMAPLVEDPSTREMAIFFIDQSLAWADEKKILS